MGRLALSPPKRPPLGHILAILAELAGAPLAFLRGCGRGEGKVDFSLHQRHVGCNVRPLQRLWLATRSIFAEP